MLLPCLHPCIITWMAIHIGGKVRLDLPHKISSTPVTLHTLFASWAGMQFGPHAGSAGAALHAMIWFLIHSPRIIDDTMTPQCCWHDVFRFPRKAPASLGYILGMVPCAAATGIMVKGYESGRNMNMSSHPIAAAAIGQMMALLVGTLWIFMLECCSKNPCKDRSLVRNFVPFLPGLLVKSIFAWALFELSRDLLQ
jgi:biotin transporter BioY